MKKKKLYRYTRFSAEVLRAAADKFMLINPGKPLRNEALLCRSDEESWSYDSQEEFFAHYRKINETDFFWLSIERSRLDVTSTGKDTTVEVFGDSRADIESLFYIFEQALPQSCLPESRADPAQNFTVFIGHGRDGSWRQLKDHLQDKHKYDVQTYESGARAGHAIRDILEDLVETSSIALLVFTSEDEQHDGSYRARQNVVHEAGLFQGKLGFPRAIMLVEDGVELFSNVAGIQYIKFGKDKIRESFGDVVATLKREFSN